MKQVYSFVKTLFLILLPALPLTASASWQLVKALPATYACTITPSGRLLVADYQFDGTGGIYMSADEGTSWTKTEADDHCYAKFLQAGKYIYAVGQGANIARSEDEGDTWDQLDYSEALATVVGAAGVPYTACYGIAQLGDRIYVADFSAGVLYTDDWGETWQFTDRESMSFTVDDGGGKGSVTQTENIYNLTAFNGQLYAFGVYFIYRYDADNDRWIQLRDDSNFSVATTVHGGRLFCARTIEDQNVDNPFVQVTADGETWTATNRPEGIIDNYVRCLGSDDRGLYAGHIRYGFFYSPDDGKTWQDLSDGLPVKTNPYDGSEQTLTPLDIVTTDQYVYMTLYDYPGSDAVSGLYRLPKSELTTGIGHVKADIDAPANSRRYLPDGRHAGKSVHGLYIEDGKKYLSPR